jgi:hypothetical protein
MQRLNIEAQKVEYNSKGKITFKGNHAKQMDKSTYRLP